MAKETVYTDEIRDNMKETYLQAADDGERFAVVEYFADMLGKSPASIRGVMSRGKYYIKKAYVTKNGNKPVKKEVLADQIAKHIGMTSEQAESLAKANRNVLDRIIVTITSLENDIKALQNGVPE